MGDFSVHAERVEAFLGFFSIIAITCLFPPYELVKSRKRLLLHGLAWITHRTKETHDGVWSEE